MAFKLLKHRRHKIGFGILLGFILLLLALSLLINRYWSPILAQKVKSVVLTSSDSLYRVDFSDAELHVLRGQLVIYNISLIPDTAVYNRRKLQHLAPNNLIELHVRRLIIDHIHPFSLYFKHKLNVGDIILNDPELNVSYQLNHTKDTVINDRRTPWQKISKTLKSIHIGGIFLNNIKLKYNDYSGNKVAISEVKEMSLSASDLLIDSATQRDKSRLLYCKEIIAELNNYTGKTPSGLYSYKIKHLKLSTLTSQLNIEGLSLAPVNTGTFFSKTNKDRYTLHLDSVQINHFDYLGYHKYRTVTASVLLLKRGSFALFNNPNKTIDAQADKIKSFPAIALNDLTTNLRIDTILVRHVDVAYSEFNSKSNQTGTITFNNTNGHFLNITNNKEALQKNNISTVELSTYFMNRGRLNLLFKFNLADKDAAYSYKGSLGAMDLQAINTATMPFAMVKITNGSLKEFSFDINANSRIAKGHINLLYNDLKVKLLQPDTTFGLKSKIIESLYANIFIIKHNNPDNAGEAARAFNVTYLRPKDSPFFKTIWNTLLAGIKPSAGIDAKTERSIAIKMNEQVANKQTRVTKKALRQQRRAERRRKRELKKQTTS